MILFRQRIRSLTLLTLTGLSIAVLYPVVAFGDQAPAPAATTPVVNPPPPAPPVAPAPEVQSAFYGKVIDLTTGKAVPDATVALQDKKGKVIAWTKTDAQGQYAIPIDTLKAMGLQASRRRGMLASMANGIGKVVTVPVKAAVDGVTTVVKQVNPIGAVKATAISVASGNPAPVVSQLVTTTSNTVTTNSEYAARENAARAVLGERLTQPDSKKDQLLPGEVFLAVSAPNFKAVKGKAGAYWLEPVAIPAQKKDADKKWGTRAWLETARLAPVAGDKNSEFESMAVLLGEPRLDPVLAPVGATLNISTKLLTPGGQPLVARVFAREDKKKTVVELKAQGGNVFVGQLALDPKTPIGETTVTVLALRADPIEVDLKNSKIDPLLYFAARLDEMKPDNSYDFDPRIMASENRLDIKVTVLDPKQTSPAAAMSAPATPVTPTAPATPVPVATPTPPK